MCQGLVTAVNCQNGLITAGPAPGSLQPSRWAVGGGRWATRSGPGSIWRARLRAVPTSMAHPPRCQMPAHVREGAAAVAASERAPARAAVCRDTPLRGCVRAPARRPLRWDRARPPVTVGELRSRCAHTFVPVRLLSVGVGGRAACISACVWTRAAPRRDAVLVHLGGHCEGACHCGPGRGGRVGGGRIWTHGWGATGVGVAGGSSWPVTSVAVSRSPAQVGAGISSHLYHGRGGGWA